MRKTLFISLSLIICVFAYAKTFMQVGLVKGNTVTYDVAEVSEVTFFEDTDSVLEGSNISGFINDKAFVDLGLASGTMWATCNVGSDSLKKKGNFYSWGETIEKDVYTITNYKFYGKKNSVGIALYTKYVTSSKGGVLDDKKTLDPANDVASVEWGVSWCIPTESQWKELIENCTWTYTSNYNESGAKGYIGKSNQNGNTIFFPITGTTEELSINSNLYYWSSSLNTDDYLTAMMMVYTDKMELVSGNRYAGRCVRPVVAPAQSYSVPTSGKVNNHDYVDLGLSSGLKWATCNLGAICIEEDGDFYMWGESSTHKYDYSIDNYSLNSWVNGSVYKYKTALTGDILSSSYDAASKLWGEEWRMPTKEDFAELYKECIWTWTTINGKSGYKIESMNNNNWIFLPAAGKREGTSLNHNGLSGYYWSSNVYINDVNSFIGGYNLKIYSDYKETSYSYGNIGCSIRPVTE
ncbi:MAG: hypothetical protein MJZ00_05375 [Paludibacteraceae bacterium]|nr:hypothetical protein [Paludibacteraceae bacterium]